MLREFYLKYKKQLFWSGIALVVYFLYFHNLWGYHLMDVDETRYVDMSVCMRKTRDFMTLFLNGDYFFEKPPLYFWLENLSFTVFNAVNEFTARIPGCAGAVFASFALFYTVKKYTENFKLAIISALILLSSAEFLILSKIAILDGLLATTVTIAVLSGFMTFCAEEKQKKYYWWLFYLFTGLAVLAKGIPGMAIPFGTMFFAGIYSKKIKEFFRPQYILVGFALFFLIVLPWHILMLNKYNPLFFNEYMIKHHLLRFLGDDVINRQQPFWFFIPVILCGIMPYTGSFTAMLAEKIAGIKKFKYLPFSELNKEKQFLALCLIASLVTFMFFSVSGTKLVTYIVPIYPYLAVLTANYWVQYIYNGEHKTGMVISAWIFNVIFLIAGVGFAIAVFFIPEPVRGDLLTIFVPAEITVIVFPLMGLIALKKDKKVMLFVSYLLFMTFLSGFGLHKILEMNYRFGQNDLIEYAKYAKENNLKIYTYQTGARYSLLYYSGNHVNFDVNEKNMSIDDVLNNPENVLIVRKKHFKEIPAGIKVLKEGRKYMLFTK